MHNILTRTKERNDKTMQKTFVDGRDRSRVRFICVRFNCRKSMERRTGVRALRSIVEDFMIDDCVIDLPNERC